MVASLAIPNVLEALTLGDLEAAWSLLMQGSPAGAASAAAARVVLLFEVCTITEALSMAAILLEIGRFDEAGDVVLAAWRATRGPSGVPQGSQGRGALAA